MQYCCVADLKSTGYRCCVSRNRPVVSVVVRVVGVRVGVPGKWSRFGAGGDCTNSSHTSLEFQVDEFQDI